jgi:hypothetical protein
MVISCLRGCVLLLFWACQKQAVVQEAVVAPTPPLAAPVAVLDPARAVVVSFDGEIIPSYLVLVCAGSNQRASLSDKKAVFNGVPAGPCTLYPKGPAVAASGYRQIEAGNQYLCRVNETITSCQLLIED